MSSMCLIAALPSVSSSSSSSSSSGIFILDGCPRLLADLPPLTLMATLLAEDEDAIAELPSNAEINDLSPTPDNAIVEEAAPRETAALDCGAPP